MFGYLPLATELVVHPTDVGTDAFTDAAAHRVQLHLWYNRYYLCDTDPIWSPDGEDVQATMWPLFMTSWALAEQLKGHVASVVVSSASSKTALSLAWALRRANPAPHRRTHVQDEPNLRQGVGSLRHRRHLRRLSLQHIDAPFGYVDAAGSPAITERVQPSSIVSASR